MDAVRTLRAVKSDGDFSQVSYATNAEVPEPKGGEVLLEMHASSVNPVDWKVLAGFPGLKFPHTLGFDAAGVVKKTGPSCKRLKVGDAVWADLGKTWLLRGGQLGAYAQFAIADESQVGLMPKNLNFTEAASLPLVALTSAQALKKCGAPWKPSPGNNFTVAVTSGSGGTGFTGIQLARAWGASNVWTATSGPNVDFVESCGATDVVNYKEQSLWDAIPDNSLDVVYDNFGAPGTADKAMQKIKKGGVFIFLPGKGGALSKHPKPGVKQINYGLCDSSKYEGLDELKLLVEERQLRPHLDQIFPLADIVGAFNASYHGKVVGKLGVKIV
eukprot:g8507.t1